MKRFLSGRASKDIDNMDLMLESIVIIIAQHFHISPMEVWNMPPTMVKKLHGWVVAIQDEKRRMINENTPTKGGDTVSLDYSAWFEGDDIHG